MKKALIALLLFSSCSTESVFLQHGAKAQPATLADQVKVYARDQLPYRFQVLGTVSVDAYGDGDTAFQLLREKAASIGATDVINVRLTTWNSYARTGVTGVAVRKL